MISVATWREAVLPLIRCSEEEAELIRASAKRERRTISAHVLKIVLHHLALVERLEREHVAALRRRGFLPWDKQR